MCGIFGIIGTCEKSLGTLRGMMARGPDDFNCIRKGAARLYHSRLAIVGLESKESQPFVTDNWIVSVNGEIYNHVELGSEPGASDCSVILSLLQRYTPSETCRLLNGVFSFLAYQSNSSTAVVARDPIGVTPLYYGVQDGVLYVSSLLETMPACVERVKIFPPGTVGIFQNGIMQMHCYTRHYRKTWHPLTFDVQERLDDVNTICNEIVSRLETAVQRRLMGSAPWGVLLSGGLDSTIVAALAVRNASKYRPDYPVVHSFSIGLHDSPDIQVARRVAEAFGTVHHEYIYTVEEGMKALKDVIRAVETYDVTTIRASTPMWILSKYIKKHGIKMVLSGEGADELFAGYKYNEWCPSPDEMCNECIRKMDTLHAYDCLRANKSTGDHGVECRVPFLDKDFIHYVMNQIWPGYKMTSPWKEQEPELIEKWILRRAFASIIPEEVCDRAKAQFSDAVGNRWIDALKGLDEPVYYKQLFDSCFPGRSDSVITGPSVACSSGAAISWNAEWKEPDPSGNLHHSLCS
jgi:asparagine synthase (glutamine-hydrolysing)